MKRPDDYRLRRRSLLGLVATSAVLAGCLGDDDEETDDESGGNDTEPNETDPNGNETDSNGNESDPNGNEDEETDDEFDPEASAREFVQTLADREFEAAAAAIDPAFADRLDAGVLRQFWGATGAQLGSLEELELERLERSDPRVVLLVTARFEGGAQPFEVGTNPDGIDLLTVTNRLWDAPPYVDQSSFLEASLSLDATENCSLGGALSLPGEGEQIPGVVIVHGSGPVDRDGTQGPNRTYRELAWGLATRGIATLRYDKRTFACDVDLADVTVEEAVIDDAVAALDRLASTSRVGDTYLVGHSAGGLLAGHIAERASVDGVVLLAPPGRSIADLLEAQNEHILELNDLLSESRRQQQLATLRQQTQRLRELDIGDDEVLFGLGGDEYWEFVRNEDHVGAVADLEVPKLLAFGGQDWQVTVEDDLPVWRDALDETADIRTYENLNHHFQHSEGRRTRAEYADPDAFVARRLVEDVAEFVTGE
jgi:pimeloyl-ACP methyl ester carboxylesterase